LGIGWQKKYATFWGFLSFLAMSTEAKEKRFLDALESLFTGAEVEGDSGFINLMRLKRGYFKSLRPKLVEAIDGRAAIGNAFREELFDKLHTFFSRYFCESGSIYFRHHDRGRKTALHFTGQTLFMVGE
jgi:hypothetical protein